MAFWSSSRGAYKAYNFHVNEHTFCSLCIFMLRLTPKLNVWNVVRTASTSCNEAQSSSSLANKHAHAHGSHKQRHTERERERSAGAHAQYFSPIAYTFIHISYSIFSIHFLHFTHMHAHRLVSLSLSPSIALCSWSYACACVCIRVTATTSGCLVHSYPRCWLTWICPSRSRMLLHTSPPSLLLARSLSLIFCFFRCMCRSIQCFVAFRCIAVVCVNVRKRERRMNQMTRFQRRPSCQNSFVYVCWCVRVCVRPCLCMSVAF